MSLRIGYCPLGRIDELMAFIDRDWKQGHVFGHDEELLRWQHRHRSDPDLLTVLLAEDDDGPVGMLGVIHADYCHRGARLRSGWLALWFTKPGARGSPGLALIQKAMSGDDDILGTARFVEAPQRIYEGMGFHVIDAIPRWVAAVDGNALRGLLAAADEPYPDPFLHTPDRAGENAGSLRVESWSPEIERAWDEVWEKEFAPEFQGVCRDSGFLRWRYLEHPRWQYTLRAAVDGSGRPRAIAVSRIESLPGREESVFRILDLVFRDRESGVALASKLMETARAQGAAFADFYCTSAAAAAPLESLGFVRESSLERHLPALFQPLDFRRHDMNAAFWSHGRRDAHERYSDLALYVTRIEGDQDRPN